MLLNAALKSSEAIKDYATHVILCLLLLAMSASVGRAAPSEVQRYDISAHYIKHEYRIPMRDGVQLFTTLFEPKSHGESYPILLQRTPYMAMPMPHSPPEDLAEAGYIFVFQDARGTYRSEGEFLELSPRRDRKPGGALVDESTDAYDTVEWLLSHVQNNNGKVGIYGWSYEGFYTAASITNTHPAIKAADIEIMGDWNYHHGAFMLGDNFEFYVDYKPKGTPDSPRLKYWTRDAYSFFLDEEPLSKLTERYFKNDPNLTWADLLKHDTLDGYWKERDLLSHLEMIHCAVLNVGGWFDQYVPGGPIAFYQAIQAKNPHATDLLVMGPWNHGGSAYGPGRRLGYIDFGSNTAAEYRSRIRNPFFAHYLKGKDAKLPMVFAFESGSNVWREYQQWPPAGARNRTLYLREHGELSFEAPTNATTYDEYVSDPAKPVPLMGFVPPAGGQLMSPEYMTGDQRFASRRPDVLVYQTEPLPEDLTIVGPVTPRLFVSTSGTDSDWVVKLIDVFPPDYSEPQAPAPKASASGADIPAPGVALAGYQMLVRGEPMRGKFRHGWDKPAAFIPGRQEEVTFAMSDVNHTFRKGHRIMVQVQSSMFPLADLNPQTFVQIPEARPEDFRRATQRVYRGKAADSGVVIQVLKKAATPEVVPAH
jgi:hypothetical protein